jgi:uncharacterized protein
MRFGQVSTAKALLLGLILFIPLSTIVHGQDFPTIFLYVNDLTEPSTLFLSEVESIEDLCFQVDRQTSAEIAVLIVNTTQPSGIDLFSVKTFEENEIGKRGLDNGVLIVVSTDEKQWRVEVGYGLEAILNDAKVGSIGRSTLSPAFDSGDLYGGIYDATLAIGQEIVDNYAPPGGNPFGVPSLYEIDWRVVAIAVVIFILVGGGGFVFVGSVFRRRGFGGGRSGGGGAKG